jgi:hypothetical protein
VRELIMLSALTALGCGLAAVQGDLLFVAILRSDNYRGNTAFAVRYRARGVPVATRLACFVP